MTNRTIGVAAAIAVALTGCGGDDPKSDAAEPTPTEQVSSTTATPTPTTLDQTLVQLLAWCQGFNPGIVVDTGDDERDRAVLEAITADLNRNVPDPIAETWALYSDEAEADAFTTEWRAAARDLDRFWIDECSPYFSLGTKITQP